MTIHVINLLVNGAIVLQDVKSTFEEAKQLAKELKGRTFGEVDWRSHDLDTGEIEQHAYTGEMIV